jgi:hypothetical protein
MCQTGASHSAVVEQPRQRPQTRRRGRVETNQSESSLLGADLPKIPHAESPNRETPKRETSPRQTQTSREVRSERTPRSTTPAQRPARQTPKARHRPKPPKRVEPISEEIVTPPKREEPPKIIEPLTQDNAYKGVKPESVKSIPQASKSKLDKQPEPAQEKTIAQVALQLKLMIGEAIREERKGALNPSAQMNLLKRLGKAVGMSIPKRDLGSIQRRKGVEQKLKAEIAKIFDKAHKEGVERPVDFPNYIFKA